MPAFLQKSKPALQPSDPAKEDSGTRDDSGAELDADACYRALQTHDARFDGRFFTAVKTTGIFCRPICTARTPFRRNVEFFKSAAGAFSAGYRPCLRCRPELAPRAWTGNGAALYLQHALALIDQGFLEDRALPDLAAKIGVTDRHLRRLFVEHLGASPIEVAQTRRLLFAKQLLDQTALPITQVALAAGYGSLRRFNDAFRSSYKRSPSEMRARRAAGGRDNGSHDDTSAISLRLGCNAPYQWAALSAFAAGRAFDGIEEVGAASYRRVFMLDGAYGSFSLAPAADTPADTHQMLVSIRYPKVEHLGILVERIRRMFDLNAGIALISAHLGRDPLLKKVVKKLPGLRIPGAWDPFELAIRAVLGQQVSVRGATTLAARLVDAYGAKLPAEAIDPAAPQLNRLFPEAKVLARADYERIGLTRARAQTLRTVAGAYAEDPELFADTADLDAFIARLTALPGIGEWTAQYIAMRALRHPDAFPASDLGLLRAVAAAGHPMSAKELLQYAERWRPWRAYAAMYLWMSETVLKARSALQ
jgi:AraC family transcriptional regulator, regulatory protein of adaptative response / DNA-3-methyladenine glycosylase II